MVVLDTNIIIDHLRQGNSSESVLLRIVQTSPNEDLAISLITIQELYTGSSSREARKEADMLATILPLRLLPYTYEIAQRAGALSRDVKTGITFADAAIAATALAYDAPLHTLNTKDFKKIPGLKIW